MAGRSTPRGTAGIAALVLAAAALVAACSGAGTPAPASPGGASAVPSTSTESSPSTAPSASAVPSPSAAAAASLPPLDCAALVRTPEQTEGPYFTPGSPERSDLRDPGMAGTTLVVSGYVVTTDCTPVAGAVIDVWQADSTGAYDNSGYTLRGHLLSAADGSYTFTTIVPGIYPGRTEHIHVKVTPPGGATLTTQLYFPGVAENDGDGIFDPAVLLTIAETADGLGGTFIFVL